MSLNSYGQFTRERIVKNTNEDRSFNVSYYCLQGKMANGKHTAPGFVAADFRYHPLGTKLLINGIQYTVADSGSNIKGYNRIDIWVGSCKQAIAMGRKILKGRRI